MSYFEHLEKLKGIINDNSELLIIEKIKENITEFKDSSNSTTVTHNMCEEILCMILDHNHEDDINDHQLLSDLKRLFPHIISILKRRLEIDINPNDVKFCTDYLKNLEEIAANFKK